MCTNVKLKRHVKVAHSDILLDSLLQEILHGVVRIVGMAEGAPHLDFQRSQL